MDRNSQIGSSNLRLPLLDFKVSNSSIFKFPSTRFIDVREFPAGVWGSSSLTPILNSAVIDRAYSFPSQPRNF
jgi:hypothetical protein